MGYLTKKRFKMMIIGDIGCGMTLAPTFIALKKYKEAVDKRGLEKKV